MRLLPFRRRPAPTLTVVTRRGCHLCEEMLAEVRGVLAERRAPVPAGGVRELDLDEALARGELDAALHERWTTLVPVLLVDDREVAHHRVAPDDLRSALRRR